MAILKLKKNKTFNFKTSWNFAIQLDFFLQKKPHLNILIFHGDTIREIRDFWDILYVKPLSSRKIFFSTSQD